MKTLKELFKRDKEKFVVPRNVQDIIPIKTIYDDGIFEVQKNKYSKSYRFLDINYANVLTGIGIFTPVILIIFNCAF